MSALHMAFLRRLSTLRKSADASSQAASGKKDVSEKPKAPQIIASKAVVPRLNAQDEHWDPDKDRKIRPRHAAYPPQLHLDQLEALLSAVKDYQITHHSLLKVIQATTPHSALARPVGVTLFPTLFPRACFEEAIELQTAYNALYAAVSADEEWLAEKVVTPLLETGDMFTECLWSIWAEVKKEREEEKWQGEDLVLGLFRNDYMLQGERIGGPGDSFPREGRCQIKQVEFNTFDCAGAVHASIAASMHSHLARTGANIPPSHPQPNLPANNNIINLVRSIAAAHTRYGRPRSPDADQTAILMVVQPRNFNIADERPLEYGLWDAGVPCFRILWGSNFLNHTTLTPARQLLYHHPWAGKRTYEISVVYHRAGISPVEYDAAGVQCRLRAERSAAIKCPSVLGHIAGFKRVQHALAADLPRSLERFLPAPRWDAAVRARVQDSWTRFWALDGGGGGEGVARALSEERAVGCVLKPCLEGGGNNVHGAAIPGFLREVEAREGRGAWGRYTLQERIRPPKGVENVLVSPKGWYEGPVVTELGITGCVLWKEKSGGAEAHGKVELEILENIAAGWTFKCKDEDVEEMSVVKGYSCFDCPNLV